MTSWIIFCPWKNVLFRIDETSQRCIMVSRYNSSIPKCIVRMTWNGMHRFFSHRMEFCPKNFRSNKHSTTRTCAYFLLYSVRTEIKVSALFCSISLFLFESLLTISFFTVCTCYNRFRWNRSTQFEHSKRDSSLSFVPEDWVRVISSKQW